MGSVSVKKTEDKCITIGVMSYDQQNYIEDTLKSIINQTYQDIELLVLDDASSDRTVEKIRSLEETLRARFINYQLIVHEENSGNISVNSNELLQSAHGDYFKVLGGDDLLLPDYCTVMSSVLASDLEIGYAISDMYRVDGNYRYGQQEYNRENRFVNSFVPEEPCQLFDKLLYGNFLPAPSALYKTGVLKQIGGFDEEFSIEDYPMWLKLSRAGIQHKYLDKPYVLYRVNDKSLSLFSGEERKKRIKKFENIADNEIRVIDKYCADLDREKYVRSMAVTMENMALLCCRLQIPEEGTYLDVEAEKRRLPLSPGIFTRDDSQISVLRRWQNRDGMERFTEFLEKNKIYRVAVYGYGERGRRLVRFLEKAEVSVLFLIDRVGQNLSNQYCVYKPEDTFPEIDAAIVSPYHVLNDEQKHKLMEHGCRTVIDLEDILLDEILRWDR